MQKTLNILVTNLENKFMNLNIYKKEELELHSDYIDYNLIPFTKDITHININNLKKFLT